MQRRITFLFRQFCFSFFVFRLGSSGLWLVEIVTKDQLQRIQTRSNIAPPPHLFDNHQSPPPPADPPKTMAPPSREESEAQVRSWGFAHVFTWTDGPYASLLPFSSTILFSPSRARLLADKHRRRNAHYAPHSHHCLTTHLIRRGTLTITYPADERPTKETFGVGSRVDVEAGRVHEVWMGDEGCDHTIEE